MGALVGSSVSDAKIRQFWILCTLTFSGGDGGEVFASPSSEAKCIGSCWCWSSFGVAFKALNVCLLPTVEWRVRNQPFAIGFTAVKIKHC